MSSWDIPLEDYDPIRKQKQGEYWAPIVSDPDNLRPKYEAALGIIQDLTASIQELERACELLKRDNELLRNNNKLLRSKIPRPPSTLDDVPSFL